MSSSPASSSVGSGTARRANIQGGPLENTLHVKNKSESVAVTRRDRVFFCKTDMSEALSPNNPSNSDMEQEAKTSETNSPTDTAMDLESDEGTSTSADKSVVNSDAPTGQNEESDSPTDMDLESDEGTSTSADTSGAPTGQNEESNSSTAPKDTVGALQDSSGTVQMEGKNNDENQEESDWEILPSPNDSRVGTDHRKALDNLPERKNFYVHLAGKTNDAHQDIVRMFTNIRQNQVSSPGASDYLLVFCPIASKVGTDISEALDNLPDRNKQVMLVVMHHTFQPEHVVIPSSQQVDNPNVFLTVDVLFYNHELLKCPRNDNAWSEIQKALAYSPPEIFLSFFPCPRWLRQLS
ncbi:uncharacterized protein si:ch211-245h14.1 [Centropristis striata]|uniref:uncharacterized protein si:ch211-245h14.1 n=1 Tax=Centropristis striata TaxID=184440 RepID=UPI0027E1DAB5|nr:uncharacterized protein si:ch211-245h14.1 [Centropristis striata]